MRGAALTDTNCVIAFDAKTGSGLSDFASYAVQSSTGELNCFVNPDRVTPEQVATLRGLIRKSEAPDIKLSISDSPLVSHGAKEADEFLSVFLMGLIRTGSKDLSWELPARNALSIEPRFADVISLQEPARKNKVAFIRGKLRRLAPLRYFIGLFDPRTGETECLDAYGLRDGGINWLSEPTGRYLSDFPDQKYVEFTTDGYQEFISRNEPIFHQLSIDLKYPCGRQYQQDYYRVLISTYDARLGRYLLVSAMSDLKLPIGLVSGKGSQSASKVGRDIVRRDPK